MIDFSETLELVLLSTIAPAINLIVTVGLFALIFFLLRRRSRNLATVFGLAALGFYIVANGYQAFQRYELQKWQDGALETTAALALPKSLWIDPGDCSEECDRFHGSYLPSWENNPAILSLLFEGGLDYVDFGHDEIWRFRRATNAQECGDNSITPGHGGALSQYAVIHHICASGLRVAQSDAELKITSSFEPNPFDPVVSWHHVSLSEQDTGTILAEGQHAYHNRPLLPLTFNVLNPMGHKGAWTRSSIPTAIRKPAIHAAGLSVWSFHLGLGPLDEASMIARFGIDPDQVIDAIADADSKRAREAILFACHNRDILGQNVLAAIDARGAGPTEDIASKLARSARSDWCADPV